MAECKIPKFYYGTEDDKLNIAIFAADALSAAKQAKLLGNSDPVQVFYLKFLDNLNNPSSGYRMLYTKDTQKIKDLWDEKIIAIKETLFNILKGNSMYESINLSKLEGLFGVNCENFFKAMGVVKVASHVIENEDKAEILGSDNMEEPEEDLSYKKFVDLIYKTNIGANRARYKLFSREIFNFTVCDFTSTNPTGKIIKTLSDLNFGICDYLNTLYKIITDYLKTLYPSESFSESMYNSEGELLSGHDRALNMLRKLLISDEDLNTKIESDYIKKLARLDTPLLDAVNALTNILYIDDNLKDCCGRYISLVSNGLKNKFSSVGGFYGTYKYKFAIDEENRRKSWAQDADARTAAQNTSKFSKMILEYIPLISDNTYTEDTVGTVKLLSAYTKVFSKITKLFNLNTDISDNSRNSLNKLYNYISKLHSNPIYYSALVTQLIASDTDLLNQLMYDLGIAPNELAVFKSMALYVFGFESVDMSKRNFSEFTSKTLKALQTKERRNRVNLGKYTILEDICGVIDDCVDLTFTYTQYSNDGEVNFAIRDKSPRDNKAAKYIAKVNGFILNVPKTVLEQWNKTIIPFNESGTTKEISFVIPGFKINGEDVQLQLKLSDDGLLGYLTHSSSYTFDNVGDSNVVISINDAFEELDLNDQNLRLRLLSNADLSDTEHNFRKMLEIFDSMLKTNFLTPDGLFVYLLYKNLLHNKIEKEGYSIWQDLLFSCVKALKIANIYADYQEKALEDSSLSLGLYLKRNTIYKNVIGQASSERTYLNKIEGDYNILTIAPSTDWARTLKSAESILYGDNIASQSKNQDGTNDANTSTAYLGAQILYILSSYRNEVNEQPKATTSLMFTENPLALKLLIVNSDLKNRLQKVKKIKDAKSSELFFNSIFHNFYESIAKFNCITVLPTTYSDKTKFVLYLISTDYHFTINGKKKSLLLMTFPEIELVYFDTIGLATKIAFLNTKNKLIKVFGLKDTATVSEINLHLLNLNEDLLIALAWDKGIDLELDTDYRTSSRFTEDGKEVKCCRFNEVLDHQANHTYASSESLHTKLEEEKANFILDLQDSGVNFYIGYADTYYNLKRNYEGTDINDKLASWIATKGATKTSVANTIRLNYDSVSDIKNYLDEWTANGKLIINKGNKLNPLLEKYFYLTSLTANNLRLTLTGAEYAHPDKSKFLLDFINDYINLLIEANPSNIELKEALSKYDKKKVYKFVTEDLAAFNLPGIYELKQYLLGNIGLSELYNNTNPNIKNLVYRYLTRIENAAQGTLLKRNVIIPATMHYVHQGDLKGVGNKIKVAVINDIKALVFNFRGDTDKIDSMDGSAWINPFESRLENYGLGSQEVGVDKKPIWHNYSTSSMTAGLMKFASFEMTNQRMRDSLSSDISLERMFKKMTNLLWFENGEWKTGGKEIHLMNTNQLNSRISKRKLNFLTEILGEGHELYYQNGLGLYKQIVDFGEDDGGYYTKEVLYDEFGYPAEYNEFGDPVEEKIYHYFSDNDSSYIQSTTAQIPEGFHKINSLYELWKAMGGCFTCDKVETADGNYFTFNEASNDVVTNFMNNVVIYRGEIGLNSEDYDIYDLTLRSYYLPLKEMHIGYLTNNSAMKNGTKNRNSNAKWNNDEKLYYFDMDSAGLGILMDADHDIEEAHLTEFSLVLTALEAGGRLHKYSKLVYHNLGKVAAETSKLELDAVAKIIAAETDADYALAKSELYDVVGKVLIDSMKDDDKGNLSDAIISKISNRFSVHKDHISDYLKIPFSDPSIYSLILSSFISTINSKSIKRKYPGSGCVMVPGYNVMLYYQVPRNGKLYKMKFEDVLKEAREAGFTSTNTDALVANREIVKNYLTSLRNDESLIKDRSYFVPSDIVTIVDNNGVERILKLDDLQTYYNFYDKNWSKLKFLNSDGTSALPITESDGTELTYKINITLPKNLAPARIRWKLNNLWMNIFNTAPIRKAFFDKDNRNRAEIQKVFDDLDRGIYNGQKITDLENLPAELIIANGYASKLGIEGKSVADIEKLGYEAFKINPPTGNNSENWDIMFGKANGDVTYITFDRLKIEKGNENMRQFHEPFKLSRLKIIETSQGALDIWLTSDDNRPLFKIGRQIRAVDKEGNPINYHAPEFDQQGNILKEEYYYNSKGEIIPKKNTKNYIINSDGTVMESIYYILQYSRIEATTEDGKVTSTTEYPVYLIDRDAMWKVFTKSGNAKADADNFLNFIRSALDAIYSSDLYATINVNRKLNKKTAHIVLTSVNGMKTVSDYVKQEILKPILSEIKTLQLNGKEDIEFNQTALDLLQELCFDKLALERYSSWRQSLIYTAARIPALTLQSFMLMQAIAYTGNNKNVVHVSHWQTWLLGSDYRHFSTLLPLVLK